MKTKLTKEQSTHLIELGVPYTKAGGRDVEYTDHIPRRLPIFTIIDLLEILPKEIDISKFYMIRRDGEWDVGYCYYNGDELYPFHDLDFDSFKHKEELIDALYELTVWSIENGHLKFD